MHLHSGGPDSIQKQLRVALNVNLLDKVSIVKLREETKTLTFNQLAIESMRKLVMTILKNESKGLKDFLEANMPQEKGLRSGEINSTLRQQAGQSFWEQAIRVWNWPHLDKARWAKKNAQIDAAWLPIDKVTVIMIFFTFWSLYIYIYI
jgi:hypothetical protein